MARQRAQPVPRPEAAPKYTVRVLEHDPGLAGALSPEELEAASRAAVAAVGNVAVGTHEPGALFARRGLLGLLLLDGLLTRQVLVAGRSCGELVGPGALLRPWDHFGEHAPMPFEVRWRVIRPLRVALLDQRFLAAVARWPALVDALVQRAIERAHTLAFNVAIHCLKHVDLRLLVLLWHLADRFGRVTSQGTLVPLPLTHDHLAELVGAQRPTVSAALSDLDGEGRLHRAADGRGWILTGDPPEELNDLRQRRDRAQDHGDPGLGVPGPA